MTVSRRALVRTLHDLLRVDEFDDYCVNGLQVQGRDQVDRVITGVSVSRRLFEAAIERRADAILVHHGLFWKSDPHPMALRGVLRDRLALLLRHDISLLAYHLPLDAHPELGNNAVLCRRLGLSDLEPVEVGLAGTLDPPPTREALAGAVGREVGQETELFAFGPERCRRVAVISGGSLGMLDQVVAAGCDTFVNGDRREQSVRELEELGLNHVFAGHYATERFGVRALGEHLAGELGLEVEFVDVPNPV